MAEATEEAKKKKLALEERKKTAYNCSFKFVCFSTQLFALSVPSLYDYKGLSVFYILYVFIYVCGLTALFLWTLIYKAQNYYGFIDKTMAIDFLTTIFYTTTNVVGIVCFVKAHRKTLINALKQAQEISKSFAKDDKLQTQRNEICIFTFATLLFHLLIISLILCVILLGIFKVKDLLIQNHVLNIINLYMVTVVSLQIENYAAIIAKPVGHLNEKLLTSIEQIKKTKKGKPKGINTEFLRVHDKISDTLEMFNSVLGLPLLLMVYLTILQGLQTLNFILEYMLALPEISIKITIVDVLLSVGWTIILLVKSFEGIKN